MSENSADVVGMADFLADLVSSNTADSDEHHDYPIPVGDGEFAIVSLETAAVYLVSVREAHFVPASNQDSAPASSPLRAQDAGMAQSPSKEGAR